MKKLAIFGLALMLVFGMSTMSFAADSPTGNPIDGTVADDITVNLTVEEYAELTINGSIDPTLASQGQTVYNTATVDVQTNTPVQLSVGSVSWDSHGTNGVTSSNLDNLLTTATGIVTDSTPAELKNYTVANNVDLSAATDNTETIRLATTWNSSPGTGDWDDLKAADYTGTITVTVESQTP